MIASIRGMNDILPEQIPLWRYFQTIAEAVFAQYGYAEIRFPVLEHTRLFERLGDGTDVSKEMYTFVDRNGDSLSLRPEGTAGCVRAAIEHGLLHHQVQRLWYFGPMFRHERPQKGRYRQFYSYGLEALGVADPAMDLEILGISARLFRQLGLLDRLSLEINTLGTPEVGRLHREALVTYFTQHQDLLDEDSLRRLHTNPLRILDSKNPDLRALILKAPMIQDFLDETSRQHFEFVCEGLQALGISFKINPQLVRGLDYYSHTVFEWTTTELGAQSTVCGGGRYDRLVEQCGGSPTPAVGFGMGVERILLMLQTDEALLESLKMPPQIYCIASGTQAQLQLMSLAEKIRTALPNLRCVVHTGRDSFKSQFKKADKSGASLAIILGEEELLQHQVSVKFLRETDPQQHLLQSELIPFLVNYFERSSNG